MAHEINLEELASELYGLLGHKVESIIERENGASDLVITADTDERWIVRCIRSKEVTDSTLREFFPVLAAEKARQGAIVTTGAISPQARELANGRPLYLLDGQLLQDYLRQARGQAQQDTITASQESIQAGAKPLEVPLASQPKSGAKATRRKVSDLPILSPARLKAQQRLSYLFVIGLVAILCIANAVISSNQLSTATSVSPTRTIGVREFGYGETILRCGNYRVEKGDLWETVATVCDMSTWEQVSVEPDHVYPGKH